MATYFNDNSIIFHNGHLVKAKDARIDLYSQTMHYGYGVFEGIRSYKTVKGNTAIFKPIEHFERLHASAQALGLPYSWSVNELIEATYSVLRTNEMQDAYIRPLVYAPANMSFNPNSESYITIQAWPMEPFLGEKLLNVFISDFERPNPKAFPIQAKACGHYVNSILASQQAKAKGFDEALLIDREGNIAEGPGANIFLQVNGKLVTPALGNILSGITRATVLELCRGLQIQVEERVIHPSEIEKAESAFFCGTAAEVIGIQKINQHAFTLPWNQSLGYTIQQAYKALVVEK
ncbi:MAG TPA: branched-chain-amino-acid transaminase [Phnomibacter sp.]|nr:branched-chain-amino-acid transaminase [Phnomibacter sp.]